MKLTERIKGHLKKEAENRRRRAIHDLTSSGNYIGALFCARHNCENNGFTLTREEIETLKSGFNEYQDILKNLERYVK